MAQVAVKASHPSLLVPMGTTRFLSPRPVMGPQLWDDHSTFPKLTLRLRGMGSWRSK